MIGLAVYKRSERQTVGERRIFVGPAQCYRSHRHDELWQTEHVDNHLRHIYGGAEIAEAESFFLGKVTEGLCVEQCV